MIDRLHGIENIDLKKNINKRIDSTYCITYNLSIL